MGTFKFGDQIAYLPDHANDNLEHQDVEFGFVTGDRDHTIFCRYWSKSDPQDLRTKANSEGAYRRNIVRYTSRPQSEIDEVIEKYQITGAPA